MAEFSTHFEVEYKMLQVQIIILQNHGLAVIPRSSKKTVLPLL